MLEAPRRLLGRVPGRVAPNVAHGHGVLVLHDGCLRAARGKVAALRRCDLAVGTTLDGWPDDGREAAVVTGGVRATAVLVVLEVAELVTGILVLRAGLVLAPAWVNELAIWRRHVGAHVATSGACPVCDRVPRPLVLVGGLAAGLRVFVDEVGHVTDLEGVKAIKCRLEVVEHDGVGEALEDEGKLPKRVEACRVARGWEGGGGDGASHGADVHNDEDD